MSSDHDGIVGKHKPIAEQCAEVDAWIDFIRHVDRAIQHQMRDALYEEALTIIANGQTTDPIALANHAIAVEDLDLTYWFE